MKKIIVNSQIKALENKWMGNTVTNAAFDMSITDELKQFVNL